jgi:D-inositol-3-phosphate glycosyltransferase
MEVALLTGGFDKPYVFGLTMALIAKSVRLDVVGSDDVDSPEMHATAHLNFLNLRGSKGEAGIISKISRVLIYYRKLILYAMAAKPNIFHILWNNKFEVFDRTVLMLYYKLLGKKVLFTAHNVNAGKRDANDSLLNQLTLRAQYRLADHIFVHTELMKRQLLDEFRVDASAVTVIPFGINNAVPQTRITTAEAKQRHGIARTNKTILFFGSIRPYKGVDRLVAAFQKIAHHDTDYRLVIAGKPLIGSEKYARDFSEQIASHPSCAQVVTKLEFVPDDETELYFKAADVLVLPYVHIFQSGVLFLAYSFGLPVVASDIGSFHDDVIEGKTGFLYNPDDPMGLADALERYFASDLYKELDLRRADIRRYAEETHSWDSVGETTVSVYKELLTR